MSMDKKIHIVDETVKSACEEKARAIPSLKVSKRYRQRR